MEELRSTVGVFTLCQSKLAVFVDLHYSTLAECAPVGNPAGNTQISQSAHSQLLRKKVTISSSWNSHFGNSPINEWKYTVEILDSGKFICSDLISHRVGVEDIPALFDGIKNRTISICKALYVSGPDRSQL